MAIPVDRRRKIIATTKPPWFEPGLDANLQRRSRQAKEPMSVEHVPKLAASPSTTPRGMGGVRPSPLRSLSSWGWPRLPSRHSR